MSRYIGPKARLCRREGINLFGTEKYQKILQNRPGTPGVHGAGTRKKYTQFGTQLREKQKMRYMFGVTEKQLHNYYMKASAMSGDTGEQFFSIIERRIDNVLYRAGFSKTRPQARQYVTHGHILLNGKKASIPSIQVKVGDVITLKEDLKKNPAMKTLELDKYHAPAWLKVDNKQFEIVIQNEPKTEDFEKLVEPQLVVEFYSR